jgi:hypothetical protein
MDAVALCVISCIVLIAGLCGLIFTMRRTERTGIVYIRAMKIVVVTILLSAFAIILCIVWLTVVSSHVQ